MSDCSCCTPSDPRDRTFNSCSRVASDVPITNCSNGNSSKNQSTGNGTQSETASTSSSEAIHNNADKASRRQTSGHAGGGGGDDEENRYSKPLPQDKVGEGRAEGGEEQEEAGKNEESVTLPRHEDPGTSSGVHREMISKVFPKHLNAPTTAVKNGQPFSSFVTTPFGGGAIERLQKVFQGPQTTAEKTPVSKENLQEASSRNQRPFQNKTDSADEPGCSREEDGSTSRGRDEHLGMGTHQDSPTTQNRPMRAEEKSHNEKWRGQDFGEVNASGEPSASGSKLQNGQIEPKRGFSGFSREGAGGELETTSNARSGSQTTWEQCLRKSIQLMQRELTSDEFPARNGDDLTDGSSIRSYFPRRRLRSEGLFRDSPAMQRKRPRLGSAEAPGPPSPPHRQRVPDDTASSVPTKVEHDADTANLPGPPHAHYFVPQARIEHDAVPFTAPMELNVNPVANFPESPVEVQAFVAQVEEVERDVVPMPQNVNQTTDLPGSSTSVSNVEVELPGDDVDWNGVWDVEVCVRCGCQIGPDHVCYVTIPAELMRATGERDYGGRAFYQN